MVGCLVGSMVGTNVVGVAVVGVAVVGVNVGVAVVGVAVVGVGVTTVCPLVTAVPAIESGSAAVTDGSGLCNREDRAGRCTRNYEQCAQQHVRHPRR